MSVVRSAILARLAGAVASTLIISGAVTARAAGFEWAKASDGHGGTIEIMVWYPSKAVAARQNFGGIYPLGAPNGKIDGDHLSLIVISHGTGGSPAAHWDTAAALADAGFVVAALTHPGDNYQDSSAAGFRHDLIDRPAHVHAVIDYMLEAWSSHERLDQSRVGMFGFSLGGFSTLVEIGGEPDLKRTLMLCREFPQAPDCGFIRDRKGDQLDPAPFEAPVWTHDPRIKAAVIAAPAASFTFGPGSLAKVSVPVQLWSAENDQMAPARWNSDLVARGLRAPLTEVHTVSRAGHFAFVTPDLCASAEPGFDCAAFHRSFNAAVVQFFRTHL